MEFDKDTNINRLRRGAKLELVVYKDEKPQIDDILKEPASNEYRAFCLVIEDPIRVSIKTNELMEVMPRYDMLYNIACDFGGTHITLIYPFLIVKMYGRNLGDLQDMLFIHRVSHITAFDPRFHVFPEGVDPETQPVITDITFERLDVDAEQERLNYLERMQQQEEQPGG